MTQVGQEAISNIKNLITQMSEQEQERFLAFTEGAAFGYRRREEKNEENREEG